MPLLNLPDFTGDLLQDFAGRRTELVTIPVIQPADPFLDMAGEDLRRRIFTTESETGEALCLRPEFTIPVCMGHIEANSGTPRRYAYCGEVFRQRRSGASEFYQAGIEDLGDDDIAAADARAVSDALSIVAKLLPGSAFTVTLGDQTVFEAVLSALGLPDGWKRRLIGAFGDQAKLGALMNDLTKGAPDDEKDARSRPDLEDRAALEDRIAGIMEETGYSTNASRTPQDIAGRLIEKARLAQARLDGKAFAVLAEFLQIDIALADAPSALAGFADAAGLDLRPALAAFDHRVAALANQNADLSAMHYRAAFGRPLDYYTGLVFEISAADAVLAGGGRYDRMMTLLGASRSIPAVGFSLWLDRIGTLRGSRQ
ncbi:ATP phosphoribosyltransferase regulatory subunit [Pararhizobium haloflavum]|uniref:ATP phosphoribosyltransferase regulatory subunit n=1 Tax=Pararhizobium haloflavum TaxID=2037914 RepID=UPI000C177472|nr:ATP phosphoribosyltransferase regulatory subunit [Pararhizobium haloflavum]